MFLSGIYENLDKMFMSKYILSHNDFYQKAISLYNRILKFDDKIQDKKLENVLNVGCRKKIKELESEDFTSIKFNLWYETSKYYNSEFEEFDIEKLEKIEENIEYLKTYFSNP